MIIMSGFSKCKRDGGLFFNILLSQINSYLLQTATKQEVHNTGNVKAVTIHRVIKLKSE